MNKNNQLAAALSSGHYFVSALGGEQPFDVYTYFDRVFDGAGNEVIDCGEVGKITVLRGYVVLTSILD
jgi:hypothetical protein